MAHWPGVPAWPITQPVSVPMKVADVGSKVAGTGAGTVAGEAPADCSDDEVLAGMAAAAGDELPRFAAPVAVVGLSTGRLTTCGTVTAAATITAAAPAVMASRRYLRRRARRLIRPNVPGGGGSGSIRPSSQESRSSRRSAIAVPQHAAQLGARREQVGLDRALGPVQQRRDLPQREAGVVVQQEGVAQPGGSDWIRFRTSASWTGLATASRSAPAVTLRMARRSRSARRQWSRIRLVAIMYR